MLIIDETREFFTHGIWRLRAERLTGKEAFVIRPLRVLLLSLREFSSDFCFYRAAVLSFYTLLAAVPAAVLIFSRAQDYGLDHWIEQWVFTPAKKEGLLLPLVSFGRMLLGQIHKQPLAAAAAAFSALFVFKILGECARSLNRIWGVKRPRPWFHKINDTLWLAIFGSILFAGAMVLRYGAQEIPWPAAWKSVLETHEIFYAVLVPLGAGVLTWFFFSFIYAFAPYAMVRAGAALPAGLLAALGLYGSQWLYGALQTGVYQASPASGVLLAFPLFLLFVQGTWVIFLYGAELSFACQNERCYEHESECKQASHRLKTVAALMITSHCAKRFEELKDLHTAQSLSLELGIPVRLVQDVIATLVRSRVLSPAGMNGTDEVHYQPGRPMETLTFKDIIEAYDKTGTDSFAAGESPEMEKYQELVERLWNRLQHSPENLSLRETFRKISDSEGMRFPKQSLNQALAAS